MKYLTTILTAGILVLYPFAVYFGLGYFQPSILTIILLALLLLRFFLMKNTLVKMPWILPATLFGAVAIVSTFFTDTAYLGFKLYPIMVNLAMFCVFAYSYFKPPSIIETFARIKEPNLNMNGVKYTGNVTLVWCAFFVINGSISLYTAMFTSLEVWMMYNGFLSYLLMGLLMAVEFIIRLKVKSKHQSEVGSVDE